MMRVQDCKADDVKQLFDWTSPGVITLTSYPDYCIVNRGTSAMIDDPIIVKQCDQLDNARLEGWRAV